MVRGGAPEMALVSQTTRAHSPLAAPLDGGRQSFKVAKH